MNMTTTQQAGGLSAGISGFTLKMIAVVTMLIDHTAASILERMAVSIDEEGFYVVTNEELYSIYMVMRIIGRMAFPIYCFLLVEGFVHTKNVKKYVLRLFVFALISELPFDMALFNSFWNVEYNNVFFTLFIGLATIAGLDYMERYVKSGKLLRILIMLCVVGAGMLVADILRTDYGMAGIATIVTMYLLRNKKNVSFTVGVLVLTFLAGILEAAALLMTIPVYFYNGTRGRQMKYFFYAFYPVHLLILAGICAILGLGI